MRPTIPWILALLMVSSLTFGQTTQCPDQTFLEILPDEDPNQIATDPVTNQKLKVARYRVNTNREYEFTGCVCEPDANDVITLVREDTGQQVAYDPNDGSFMIRLQFPSAGLYYLTMAAADGPDTRTDRKVRRGTYIFDAHVNRPPVFCGGQLR